MPLDDLLLALGVAAANERVLEAGLVKLVALGGAWFATGFAVLRLTNCRYRTGLSEIYQ